MRRREDLGKLLPLVIFQPMRLILLKREEEQNISLIANQKSEVVKSTALKFLTSSSEQNRGYNMLVPVKTSIVK